MTRRVETTGSISEHRPGARKSARPARASRSAGGCAATRGRRPNPRASGSTCGGGRRAARRGRAFPAPSGAQGPQGASAEGRLHAPPSSAPGPAPAGLPRARSSPLPGFAAVTGRSSRTRPRNAALGTCPGARAGEGPRSEQPVSFSGFSS